MLVCEKLNWGNTMAINTQHAIKTISLATLLFTAGCATQHKRTDLLSISETDKQAIAQLQKDIPLILAEQGWKPYEAVFGKDYQNWQMMRDTMLSREQFLAGVKSWYEDGNRAVGSETETIGFIPLAPDLVMYLHKQVETFDLTRTDETVARDIRFVSIFRKEAGEWKVQFTAFMDAPPT